MTPRRIFLTGDPGSGKTTAVRKICHLLESRGEKVGGMVSGEIREDGIRLGFMLEDITNHTFGILAHIAIHNGPRIGKYGVNLTDISRVGVTAITNALSIADVIIVDEIGPMELCSTSFVVAVKNLLGTSKAVVGTIHKRASHSLVSSIKADPKNEILEVTPQSRDQIPFEVGERLMVE